MKVRELIGIALDYWVAKALGMKEVIIHHGHVKIPIDLITERYPEKGIGYKKYHPSRSWRIGGHIIEEHVGNLWKNNKLNPDETTVWTAAVYTRSPEGTMIRYEIGPTPLVAAMRALVASKFGDEIPDNKE